MADHRGVVALCPVRCAPQGEGDGSESIAAKPVVAAEADGVDVGAVLRQDVDHGSVAGVDRVVQWPSPQRIAAVRQAGVAVEQFLDAVEIVVGDGFVDGVRRAVGSGGALQFAAQGVRDVVAVAVEGHLQQRFRAVERTVRQIGAVFEE